MSSAPISIRSCTGWSISPESRSAAGCSVYRALFANANRSRGYICETSPMVIWAIIAIVVLAVGFIAVGRSLQRKGRDMERPPRQRD
jgi:hypothetical protein